MSANTERSQMIQAYLPSMREAAAERPHGTRLRYISGCKCVPCRAANLRYETERAKARKQGDWNGLVDAKATREWIKHLSRRGVGRKSVSAASGIGVTAINEIRIGRKLKIRARTERQILAVDENCRADRSLVDARPGWKMFNDLLAAGYTKVWIAQQLGKAMAIQFDRRWITAKNARAIERLYRLIQAGRISR